MNFHVTWVLNWSVNSGIICLPVAVLTESVDAPAYWRKLKQRLKAEGNETVTNCHALKMQAPDGKMRMTDVADTEQLFRLIQSVPSPKAEPFKAVGLGEKK